jgi:hypothetical protein
MIVRATMMLMAGCLCMTHGEADARSKSRPKRVAAMDMSRLVVASDRAERLRNWRAARWSLGQTASYDDGSDPRAMKWRLRGAGFKMRMPIALAN